VPKLADDSIYIAFESTFYRIIYEEKMQQHSGRSKGWEEVNLHNVVERETKEEQNLQQEEIEWLDEWVGVES